VGNDPNYVCFPGVGETICSRGGFYDPCTDNPESFACGNKIGFCNANPNDRQCQLRTTTTTTTTPPATGTTTPEECPAGSPPGCYVIKSQSGAAICPSDTVQVKNTPGGPKGTMCAPIPPQNQNNPNGAIEVIEQLSDNSILPSTPTGQDSAIKEQQPKNSILTPNAFDSTVTVTKPSPASCKAQGTLFDPTMNMCKNPQSIQDCAKIMQRYDPDQGKCVNIFTS
jgi:hypothetical protein